MFNKSMIALLGLVISGCFGAAEVKAAEVKAVEVGAAEVESAEVETARVKAVEVEASPAPSWRVSSHVDEMTDEALHFAILYPVSADGSSTHTTFMGVGCSNNLTTLSIRWGTYVSSSDHRVTYRLDDEPAVSRDWVTDREGSTYPADASNLLKQAIDSNNKYFRVRTTPYSGRPVTLLFDVSEMGSALTDIRRECGW